MSESKPFIYKYSEEIQRLFKTKLRIGLVQKIPYLEGDWQKILLTHYGALIA